MSVPKALDSSLYSDRLIVIVLLVSATIASWLFVINRGGMGMPALKMTSLDLAYGGGMRMPFEMASWTAGYAIVMYFMWWVMMIAMMLPSASTAILLFMRAHNNSTENERSYLPTIVFASGYLTAWAGFSALATGAQWLLEDASLLNKMMATTSPVLGGGLLLVAGLWQFTSWKYACLRHCRSPLIFLMARWRSGRIGTFVMGMDHGAFCLGCCWFLMALLFFGGIMNLWWIGGLALYVLAEKLMPAGHWLGYGLGVILTLWGLAIVLFI